MLTPRFRLLCLSLFLMLFVADQMTKHWALGAFSQGFAQDILPGLRFTLAFNEGIGLSMFAFLSDWIAGYAQVIFGLINVGIAGGILWFFRAERDLVPVIGWTSVVAGALGNALDRFVTLFTPRTGVVDFIWVSWEPLCRATGLGVRYCHFPIFNLADCAITIGFAIVLIDMLFLAGHRERARERA